MKQQIFLPYIQQPLFCFPEAVGWYMDFPDHYVLRNQKKPEDPEIGSCNLHLVTSGKGYAIIDGTKYTLTKGDIFFCFPFQNQHYFTDHNEPWDVKWIHFYGKELTDFLTHNNFHCTHLWHINNFQPLERAILELLTACEQHKLSNPTQLSVLTYQVLIEFTSNAIPLSQTLNYSYNTQDRITKLLPMLQEQAHLPFNLERWADSAGISTYYFCRVFKQVTGSTPSNFIKLCRIQKAKQMLVANEHFSIKHIALECGYPSLNYFCKVFLANEGFTPSNYRKNFTFGVDKKTHTDKGL